MEVNIKSAATGKFDEFMRTLSREKGSNYVDEDRWIWSALGIHRVPYEFWKVGTWKPAVNARSTDSHFFFLLRAFFPISIDTSANLWNSSVKIGIQRKYIYFDTLLMRHIYSLPRKIKKITQDNRTINVVPAIFNCPHDQKIIIFNTL